MKYVYKNGSLKIAGYAVEVIMDRRVYALFVVSCYMSVVQAQKQGETCFTENGSQGECKLFTECPSAMRSLEKRKIPKTCSFDGLQVVVCCEEENDVNILPDVFSAAKIIGGHRQPGQISKEKCKEYSAVTIKKVRPPILMMDPELIEINECDQLGKPLITGGEKTSRKEFPHMAMIGYQPEEIVHWLCGGSLISERYVLTAAHCLTNRHMGIAKFVKLGTTNVEDNTNVQLIQVIEVMKHPKYRPPSLYNDIGLLKLEINVFMNSYVRPACLNTLSAIPNKRAVATGWGKMGFASESSKDLLKVPLDFFTTESCNLTFGEDYGTKKLWHGIDGSKMICAGSKFTNGDTCEGDSGGPLQVQHNQNDDIKCMYDIIGVVSFGRPCGFASIPGVYTKVSNYIKWIEDIVWPN